MDLSLSLHQRKAELRRSIRAGSTVDDEFRRAAPGVLSRFLVDNVDERLVVVVYDALPDEVDLEPMIRTHPRPGSRFGLTRTPDRGTTLSVHPWDCQREQHRLGYAQPRADAPVVPDDRIGAVIVPGLGFDSRGHRIGRGAGWYDRFLGRLAPSVLRIGLPARPLLDLVPTGPDDVTMTHLVRRQQVERVERVEPRRPE